MCKHRVQIGMIKQPPPIEKPIIFLVPVADAFSGSTLLVLLAQICVGALWWQHAEPVIDIPHKDSCCFILQVTRLLRHGAGSKNLCLIGLELHRSSCCLESLYIDKLSQRAGNKATVSPVMSYNVSSGFPIATSAPLLDRWPIWNHLIWVLSPHCQHLLSVWTS